MVLRGRTRGNGRQLANYLVTMKDNSNIEILDIDGRGARDKIALSDTLTAMSLTSDLTKSNKGLYHAQINPAYGDDKNMNAEKWLLAADMLGKALGLENQRRIIVLHTKNDRTHAHVAWERFDHAKGKMISDSFTRYKQNAVRLEMEKVFEQQKTNERSPNAKEMKEALTWVWQRSNDGAEFIKGAKEQGYIIAVNNERRPFRVIDASGTSFDLMRQLEGVKTKEVRDAFSNQKLPKDRKVIKSIRDNQRMVSVQERMIDKKEHQQEQTKLIGNEKKLRAANLFADNKAHLLNTEAEPNQQISQEDLDRKKQVAKSYSENKAPFNPNLIQATEKERIRQETLEKLKQEREKNNDKGIEYD